MPNDFALVPEDRAPGGADLTAEPTLLLVERSGSETARYWTLAKRAGFRVLRASTGMTPVVTQRARPDLVLLSPSLAPPRASELARSIKEDPKTRDVPVMILVHSEPNDPNLSRLYPTEACASAATSDDELVQTMRAVRNRRPREPVEPRPSSPLEGDLADDTFPGVLEFLFRTGRTGRLVVLNSSRRPGHIYVEEGNIIHAELAEKRGVEAFRRMCFLRRGRFKFEPEFRPSEPTMCESGMEVLLESARRHDEAARQY